ncbi:MAG: NAD-binding protein [Clostridiales bacterium]|nr:NAD-binding protein [Clostridiales bacterium]MDY5513493.1 NAD-binding protein [Candidatus Ventricola sp.]
MLDCCKQLADIKGLQVICGDGSKPYILEEAGARRTDIAIALTDSDADNLVICELCKKRFGVTKTVSVIKNAENTAFFRQMGVDAVVCATNTITGIIEQLAFVHDMTALVPVGDGRVSIAEVSIPEGAPAVSKKLWEISLPREVIVGCILRKDQTLIPRGDTRILAGDSLVLLSSAHQETDAIRALTGR